MPEPVDAAAVLAAVERSPAAVVVLDRTGAVVRWSEGATQLFGRSAAEVSGRRWLELGLLPDPMRQARGLELLEQVLGGYGWEGEWVARRVDGSTVRVHSVQQPLLDAAGEPAGAVFVTIDVSGRDAFEAALLHEALRDQLTGLPGRAVLQHHLATLLGGRPGEEPLPRATVLFVDLDDFKAVNDRFGHEAGDRVLVDVARRLQSTVRSDDLVCRVGGDEFVVVARVDGVRPSSREVGERVARALAEPLDLGDGTTVEVCASVGVVTAVVGDDPDDLVRRADAAMYRAKRSAIAPGPDHVAVGG